MRVNFLSVKYIKITKNLKTYNSKMFMLSLEMQARRLGGWINSNPHPTWFFTCCLPVSPVSRMELFCERRPPDPGCGEWGGGAASWWHDVNTGKSIQGTRRPASPDVRGRTASGMAWHAVLSRARAEMPQLPPEGFSVCWFCLESNEIWVCFLKKTFGTVGSF